jgi:hypothetical protein
MQRLLLLTTLLPLFVHSQNPDAFQADQKAIVAAERKAAEAKLMDGLQSVASGNFNVNHYRCEWQVDPAINYINGKITTTFTMLQAGSTITFDLASVHTVDSVLYHGSKISFQ